MSDLTNSETLVVAPATGGARLVVETFVDSFDSVTKVLPASSIYWGEKGGDYFLANETTPLPASVFASGVPLATAVAAPGSSDPGLVVRVAGEMTVDQGSPAVVGDSWPVKITNGTDSATITTVSAKKCLDVNVAGGAGVQYAEDAAHASGDSGTVSLVVRRDTPSSLAGTDGDYSVIQVNALGSARVTADAYGLGFLNSAVTNSLVLVVGSQAKTSLILVENTGGSKCYFQVFDAASTGAVTLGTTVPKWSFPVPAGSIYEMQIPLGFTSGVVIAATATFGGSGAPSAAVLVNVAYALK